MLHPEKYLHVLQPKHAADGCRDSCESDEPHCILGIQPDQVLEAVRRLVRAGGRVQSEIPRAAREIIEFLRSRGYHWFAPQPEGSLKPVPADQVEFDGNFVAVPDERMPQVSSRSDT